MVLVAGIGIGLFILAFLWVLTIVLCMGFSRARGAIANIGVILIFVSLVATIILIFFPRGPGEDKGNDIVIYDNYVIGRIVLTSLTGFMVIVGLILFVVFHVFEPQHAKPIVFKRMPTK